jgi:hypothetical protein
MILTITNNLAEGMVVAKPIVLQGKTLLNIGVHLTCKHIQILKAWGVSDVWVAGEGTDENSGIINIEREEFRDVNVMISLRFSKCIRCDVIQELKRIVTIRECVKLKTASEQVGGSTCE